MSVRVKICGITSPDDANSAVEAGADAIGLVFYPQSSRFVSIEQAQAIVKQLNPFVLTVGLFVNASFEQINNTLNHIPLHLLQFHGDETDQDCRMFSRPYLKALRIKNGSEFDGMEQRFPNASGFLIDTYKAGQAGGTGETFDWRCVPSTLTVPYALAGGLNSDNVQRAIQTTGATCVDVSGGVEMSPGVKDAGKMRAFVQKAKNV